MGLSAASLGEEARIYLRNGDTLAAMHLYHRQLRTGGRTFTSLSMTCAVAIRSGEHELERLARDATSRRIMTAWLLSRSGYDGTANREGRNGAWLAALEAGESSGELLSDREELLVLCRKPGLIVGVDLLENRRGAGLAVQMDLDSPAPAFIGAPVREVGELPASRELLRQAESLLVNRGFPVIPLYFYVSSGLIRPGIEGFYSRLQFPDGSRGSNLQDLHPLRDLRAAAR